MRLADLHLTSHEGAVIARLSGEIDMSNAAELRAAITESTPNYSRGVVLDLSAVDYIDSAGIQLLYSLAQNIRHRGQALRVVIPPQSAAHETLRMAGIERHVDAVEGIDEALVALATSAQADIPSEPPPSQGRTR
jgi:anti-anti-sigma factor